MNVVKFWKIKWKRLSETQHEIPIREVLFSDRYNWAKLFSFVNKIFFICLLWLFRKYRYVKNGWKMFCNTERSCESGNQLNWTGRKNMYYVFNIFIDAIHLHCRLKYYSILANCFLSFSIYQSKIKQNKNRLFYKKIDNFNAKTPQGFSYFCSEFY